MAAHWMLAFRPSVHSLSPLDAPKIETFYVRGIACTSIGFRHKALRLAHGKACAVSDPDSEVNARQSLHLEDLQAIDSAIDGENNSQEGHSLSRRHLAIGASGTLITAGTGAALHHMAAHWVESIKDSILGFLYCISASIGQAITPHSTS